MTRKLKIAEHSRVIENVVFAFHREVKHLCGTKSVINSKSSESDSDHDLTP